VAAAISTTSLTPQGEDDCRQYGSAHDESRAAGRAHQNYVGRIAGAPPTPVDRRIVAVVRRVDAVVILQCVIDDQE